MSELSPRELAEQRPGRVLVDIRRPSEWAVTGVIDGSRLLTFTETDIDGWFAALAELASPEDELVLICRTGRRTGILLEFMHRQTPYRHAKHLDTGILGWIDDDLPVVPVDRTTATSI